MIARLSGTLEELVDGHALVSVPGGLTYQVLLPAYFAERLRAAGTGKPITLVTLQYLESQGQGASFVPRLIGFEHERDRRFFELFTTVKGIGNRKALRAMAAEPAAIAGAIIAKDAKALTKLPEIGKRMAETVIAELTGKVDAFLAASEVEALERAAESRSMPADAVAADTIAALEALGESRSDAEALVARARSRAGKGAASVEELLPLALSAR